MTVLLIIVGVIGIGALLVSRGSLPQAALCTLTICAPLEIYRTSASAVNISLFRLALIPAAAVATCSVVRSVASGWPMTVRRPTFRALAGAPATAYAALLAVASLSLAANLPASALGYRQLATGGVALLAIGTVAMLVRVVGIQLFVRFVAISAVLPIVAASWQAIAPRLGASPSLPFVNLLTTPVGLEVNRTPPVLLGAFSARTKGTFGDPNLYGAFLLIAIACCSALAMSARSCGDTWHALAWGLLGLASGLSLVSTYSRSAWLGALAGLLLGALFLVRRGLVCWRGGTRRRGIVVVAVGLMFLPALPNVVKRLEPNTRLNAGSNRVHLKTAQEALDALRAHPILGIGPGWLGPRSNQPPRTSVAHSSYLTTAAEEGVIGLLVLLWCGGTVLARFIRLSSVPCLAVVGVALTAGYGALLVASLSYDLWFDDYHWLLVGAAAQLSRNCESSRSNSCFAAP